MKERVGPQKDVGPATAWKRFFLIRLAQMLKWQPFVNTVMNVQVS